MMFVRKSRIHSSNWYFFVGDTDESLMDIIWGFFLENYAPWFDELAFWQVKIQKERKRYQEYKKADIG